ncbi:hypothetical protein ILYODFUR_014692 [Ilyodon furcidens]|uniref:Uncharacterized protein n=1 Tax=Ilyodon furcidens TaxID=33524 RepID=A0ABV0U5U1_9TELE
MRPKLNTPTRASWQVHQVQVDNRWSSRPRTKEPFFPPLHHPYGEPGWWQYHVCLFFLWNFFSIRDKEAGGSWDIAKVEYRKNLQENLEADLQIPAGKRQQIYNQSFMC